ncbi:hypothetical protein D7035_12340 [Aquimarina sp. AD1]|nr:hypothetical protein D7035_12340 [Aquimarina sp. AD1]
MRPKEDKIKTEGEDTHKSFEGWQEALYIREDETEEGKKAIEDSETLATTRAAETFITLTRDADADKKENKKSYPKKISGPEDIGILGKDAVFTIDKYKSNATTKDKNNIRWCIYVDDKSTVIDAKSKAGLYTYAKSELIDVVETTAADGTVTETGGTNKLTIVFDKALEGKTIQIEPYRGAPDHKVEKDWVYENTIKGVKISKRETTALWLTSQCDSVQSPNTTIKKDFIGTLKLITPNTIHVYHDGKMSKLNLEGLTKVKYRYHDKNGEKHNVCECEIYETLKMGSGNKAKVLNTTEKASATIVDYKSKNITGVSAYKSYILSNQDVYTEGEKGSWGYTHVYYKALNEKITMVKLPYNGLNYKNGDTLIKFVWHQTLRRFSQPEVFAAFIGALAKCGFKDIKSGGSCYEDGSSYPSLSHNNGYAIDTSYIDNTREQKLINALKDYGFLVQYKGTKSKFSSLTGATALGGHNDHLHSGGAPKNGTIKFKAKYK